MGIGGNRQDVALTVVWINIPGMFAEDVLMAQLACCQSKEYQAEVDRQHRQLCEAKALLEKAKEKQQSVMKAADSAKSIVLRFKSGANAESAVEHIPMGANASGIEW